MTFPKVRAEHKMDRMAVKFHSYTALTIPTLIVPMFYLEVQVQEQTSWGRSRPSKLLTPKTCHTRQPQQRVAVFNALEMMVRCSALALVKEALSRVKVIQVHCETLSKIHLILTWLIEFHDLMHACRSSKVLPINSCLNVFKHANIPMLPQRSGWPFHHLNGIQHPLWV